MKRSAVCLLLPIVFAAFLFSGVAVYATESLETESAITKESEIVSEPSSEQSSASEENPEEVSSKEYQPVRSFPIYSAPIVQSNSEQSKIDLPSVEVESGTEGISSSIPKEEKSELSSTYAIITGAAMLLVIVIAFLLLLGNSRVGRSSHSSGRVRARSQNYPRRKHLLENKYYRRSGRKKH